MYFSYRQRTLMKKTKQITYSVNNCFCLYSVSIIPITTKMEMMRQELIDVICLMYFDIRKTEENIVVSVQKKW